MKTQYAPVAQRIEHLTTDQKVGGSNDQRDSGDHEVDDVVRPEVSVGGEEPQQADNENRNAQACNHLGSDLLPTKRHRRRYLKK